MSADQTTRKPTDRDALMRQRDAGMMEIRNVMGLTAEELACLRIRDVDLEAGSLFVHDCNGTRTVQLGPISRDHLCQYIRYIRPEIGTCNGDDALFVSICEGKPMTPRHVQRIINDYAQEANVAKLQAIAEQMKGKQP